MGKPNGLGLSIAPGGPLLSVHRATSAEDAIWDAVREAVCANWTPEQFKLEAMQAWQQALKDDAKHAAEVLSK